MNQAVNMTGDKTVSNAIKQQGLMPSLCAAHIALFFPSVQGNPLRGLDN